MKSDLKTYVLTIPRWHAVVPKEWDMEIEEDGMFVHVGGREIILYEGARLRGGPEETIQQMINQNFIREVTE